MSAITVRAARLEEASALGVLAALTFPLACPEGTDPGDIADFIANNLTPAHFTGYLSDPDASVLVAESGAELLGYSLTFAGPAAATGPEYKIAGSPSHYLSKLYVSARAHGSGVARELLAATAAAAKDRGAQSLWLATNVNNARATRFYLKNGFLQRGDKLMIVGAETNRDHTFELPL